MKYLVMECHPGYAVVLSQDGRFIKTANLNYDVGETVSDIIIMDSKPKNRLHRLFISIAAALCAALAALAVWYYALVPAGTVSLAVNPEVTITVNRLFYVLSAEGLNDDGRRLVDEESTLFRRAEEFADELVERAYLLDYLDDGGTILLNVTSDSDSWKANTENRLLDKLSEHSKHGVSVVIGSSDVTVDDIIAGAAETSDAADTADTTVAEDTSSAVDTTVSTDTNAE